MGVAVDEEVLQDFREFHPESRLQRGSFGECQATFAPYAIESDSTLGKRKGRCLEHQLPPHERHIPSVLGNGSE